MLSKFISAVKHTYRAVSAHSAEVSKLRSALNPLGRIVVDHTHHYPHKQTVGYHGTSRQFWNALDQTHHVVNEAGLFLADPHAAASYALQHGEDAVVLEVRAQPKDLPATDFESGYGAQLRLEPGVKFTAKVHEICPNYSETQAKLKELMTSSPCPIETFREALQSS